MVLKKIMGIFAITLMIGAASFATAGVPDLDQSGAATAAAGTLTMFNLPNGGGTAFADAAGGDATITLTLLDGNGDPVANFPAEDAWLEAVGMSLCLGGSGSDFNSNAAGVTVWATPLQAGGASQAGTNVSISGGMLNQPALSIEHNSADLTGDGNVNLADVPVFAADNAGGLHPFRSDFVRDGLVNLADVVKLAQALGASCP